MFIKKNPSHCNTCMYLIHRWVLRMHWKPSRWRWKTSSVGALAATAAAAAAEGPTQCWTVHALLQLVQKKVYILLALNSCSSTMHWCRSPFALQLSKDVFSLPNMGEEEPDVQPCKHLHLGTGFMDSAQCLSHYYQYSSDPAEATLKRSGRLNPIDEDDDGLGWFASCKKDFAVGGCHTTTWSGAVSLQL